MSSSDERYTPEWLLEYVRRFFGGQIPLDVCSSSSNPTRARRLFAQDGEDGFAVHLRDGLSTDWRHWGNYGMAYCNPPYSRGQVIRWAIKAIQEVRLGAEVLMLTQADVSTEWFRLLRTNCSSVCLLGKRVGFLRPDGEQMPGAKFGSAMWYFGQQDQRFRRIFETIGWVVRGPGLEEEGE